MIKMFLMSLFMFLSGILHFFMGFYFFIFKFVIILEWDLMNLFCMKFSLIIYLDYISLMFIGIVFIISSCVMIYSIEYMSLDKSIYRFFYLLILFILSMCLMILSPSVLSILLGWDGLGLISFGLVIYYQSYSAFNSGVLTILCNRLGDIGFLMLIVLNSMNGSWNLLFYDMDFSMMLFMFLGALTKSAQMPFSSWLPAAMMAPTPISSLVHSSTLVTAGIYLLIRYYNLVFTTNNDVILFISIFTMFMASLIANFEYDLKKIIALSTLSQLGLMMSILSVGLVDLAFFHLIIHALFKSMMFMCAGSFIHNSNNNQDIRCFSSLSILMPLNSIVMLVGKFSLCGFFFLSGFFSKDVIIEYFFSFSDLSVLLSCMFYLSMVFTLSYSFRLVLWIFYPSGFSSFLYSNFYESFYINLCISFLFILVIFMGMLIFFLIFKTYIILLNFYDKILILLIYFLGIYFGYLLYYYPNKYPRKILFNKFIFFLKSMYYLSYFYKMSYIYLFTLAHKMNNEIEKGLFESILTFWMKILMNFLVKIFKTLFSDKDSKKTHSEYNTFMLMVYTYLSLIILIYLLYYGV